MTDRLEEYFDLIRQGLARVEQGYYRLPTTYSPTGIVRERVFCYELYHQIRSLMGKQSLLSLHGEIDKRGHRDFKDGHRRNPDFVFHMAGTHKGNLLVVEVKGQLGEDKWGIVKDLETLLAFTSEYHYKAGLFLLYNHTLTQLVTGLKATLTELAGRSSADKVRIWCSERSSEKIDEAILSDYRQQSRADL